MAGFFLPVAPLLFAQIHLTFGLTPSPKA